MKRKINFKGNPLTLAGRILEEGNLAPDFKTVSQDLKEVGLSDFAGRTKIITSFPSVDTPVCDLQVKEFNRRASEFYPGALVLGISKDLPFAHKRFCQANDIRNVITLSDYKYSSFGINYGLLIKELNLLARAIVIVDKNNSVRYVQIVEELTNPPDYDDALRNLEEIIKNPKLPQEENLPSRCKPCEGGALPFSREMAEKLIKELNNWQLAEGKKLQKEFKFEDFREAKYFLDIASIVAEEQGHHPAMTLSYNKLKITLTTHSAGGLTENDFIMAKIIDEIES